MQIHSIKTFKDSFCNVWTHRDAWLRVAFAPLMIIACGLLVMGCAYWSSGMPLSVQGMMAEETSKKLGEVASQPFMGFANFIYGLSSLIGPVCLYINCTRYAVLREGGTDWWNLHLNRRFFRMIGCFLLIGVLVGLYALISIGIVAGGYYVADSMVVSILLGALCLIYGLYLLARISLYPLLVALDKAEPLRTSRKMLKGHVARFIGLYVLLIMAFGGITSCGLMILAAIGGFFNFIGMEVLTIPVFVLALLISGFISKCVYTKALGLVYQDLSGETPL